MPLQLPDRGLVALLLAVALFAAGCGDRGNKANEGTGTTNVKQGGSLAFAAEQEPPSFNLNTSKGSNTWTAWMLSPTLPSAFKFAPDYSIQLDKSFLDSAEPTNDNPQTVVYKVRKDATWSDGVPISADDFIYLWQNQNGSIKDNDIAATTGYEDIASVTGSDNGKTVTAVFKKKFADWKSLFSAGGGTALLPAHYMKTVPGGWNNGLLNGPPPIAGGPFVISNYTKGQNLTLSRNNKYWGQKANLDSVVFRFVNDSSTEPQALQNREVDVIYPQPQLDLVEKVKSFGDVKSEINFGLQFEHLTFNTKSEFLSQLPVRQAVAKAVDRDELVRRTVAQFDSKARRLDNRLWMTNHKNYEAHGEEYAKQDIPGAQRLLEQSGFSNGADGVYQKEGKRLRLRLRTTSGNSLREQQLTLIQAMLRQAGIEGFIDNAPPNVLFKQIPDGNFDIASFAWVSNPLPISGSKGIYVTGGGSNYGKFSDREVDQLFDQAVGELDEQRAAALANRIDERLWAQMHSLPLYQKPTFIAYRNTVVNVHDNATQEGPVWNASKWGYQG